MARPFDSETAREAGKRSAEMRARRRDKSPEERALEAIRERLGALTKELLSAALGEGAFADLKNEERLKAVVRALEWGLGRPTTVRPEQEAKATVPTAEELFGE